MKTHHPRRKPAKTAERGPNTQASKKRAEVLSVAKKSFGFEELRPGQEEPILSLLANRDTLVVMPTGSGKSAIYQIAGMMKKGSVLVISPLIALQKDQADSLNSSRGTADAVLLNSSLPGAEFRDGLDRVARGECKFIFLAPEQLQKQETLQALEKAAISMIVIDEAHCISEWGHDFRPDYLQLGKAIELLGHPVTIAMTATASERVRQEMIERLAMKRPSVFVRGFDRPNIYLRVDHFEDEPKKREALLHRVRWTDKPGIVYVATRKSAEEIVQSLTEEGMKALFYHGGLAGAERHEIQDRFMSGDADVIVATNAFGMGIDHAAIRFVYHHDAPDSIDSYYQEIGRAGRDGEKAEAILFFREQDIGAQAFHTGAGKIDLKQLDVVVEAIAETKRPLDEEEIAEQIEMPPRKLRSAIQKLEDAGAIEVLPSGDIRLEKKADLEQAVSAVADQQEELKESKKERLQQMRAYADTLMCRREHLLRYFGDKFTGPCNNCDNCEAEHPETSVDPGTGTRREVA